MCVGGEFGVELGVGGIDTATVGVSEISFFSSVFFFFFRITSGFVCSGL